MPPRAESDAIAFGMLVPLVLAVAGVFGYVTYRVVSGNRRKKRALSAPQYAVGGEWTPFPERCVFCGVSAPLATREHRFPFVTPLGAVAAPLGVHYEKHFSFDLPSCARCDAIGEKARRDKLVYSVVGFAALLGSPFVAAAFGGARLWVLVLVAGVGAAFIAGAERVGRIERLRVLWVNARNVVIDVPGLGPQALLADGRITRRETAPRFDERSG